MTRLLLFLAAYFAGSIATNHGQYGGDMNAGGSTGYNGQKGDGDLTAGAGSGDNGQGRDGSVAVPQLNTKEGDGQGKGKGEGKGDVINVSIKVIEKGKGGRTPKVNLGEPAMPPGKTHQVTVGGSAGLVYTPDSLVAEPGDMVQFNFLSKNHTVTQSAFAKPCVKLADGVDSGFMPNGDETVNPPPTYMFQVLDKEATWFYCRQGNHCGAGMTFSINPTAEKSQAKFKQLAIEQNGTAGGSYGAAGGSPPPPKASPAILPPAGTGIAAPSGTAPAASGAFPIPPANSTIYSAPLQPPQGNNAAEATGTLPPAPGATQPANLVNGAGNNESGQCQCSCLCGVAPFPAGAGVGMWGGMPGTVPS